MTQEEIERTFRERVPESVVLQIVYAPLFITESAVMLLNEVHRLLALSRVTQVKRESRHLNEVIRTHEKDFDNIVGSKVAQSIRNDSVDMFSFLQKDMEMMHNVIVQEMYHRDIKWHESVIDLLSYLYVAQEVLKACIDETERLVGIVRVFMKGTGISYTNTRREYADVLIPPITALLKAFGMPPIIENDHVSTCRRIIDNKVRNMHYSICEGRLIVY